MTLARRDIPWLLALVVSLACALAAPTAFADGGRTMVAPVLEQEAPDGAAGVGEAEPVVEVPEQPAVEEQLAVAEQPAGEEQPPAEDRAPVVEHPAAAQPAPQVDQPVVEQPAAAESAPRAAQPAVDDPVAAQPPVAPQEPAPEVEPLPVAPPEPSVGEEPAADTQGPPVMDPVVMPEPTAPTAGGGNINVIIRIFSPGDDGPVQQIGGGGGGLGMDWNWTWHWDWTCAPTAAAWDWDWTWTGDCAGGLAPHVTPPLDATERPHLGIGLGSTDAWRAGGLAAPVAGEWADRLMGTDRPAGDDRPAGKDRPARQRREDRDRSAGGIAGPAAGVPDGGSPAPVGGPPSAAVAALTAPSGARQASATAGGGGPARSDGDRDPRAPAPDPPTPGPAATAGTGGGGIGSLLLAAVLAGLVLLAPRRARHALGGRRAPRTSLGSSRPERPG